MSYKFIDLMYKKHFLLQTFVLGNFLHEMDNVRESDGPPESNSESTSALGKNSEL